MSLSRRRFVQAAGTSLLLPSTFLKAEPVSGRSAPDPQSASSQTKVALVHGDDRRQNVFKALLSIDDQIRPGLRYKTSVVIKPNNVSTERQLAATHVDALAGILDYLEPRFHGPVYIAESSAGDTLQGFESFHYDRLVKERRAQKVSLVDLNREGKYDTISLIDYDLHIRPVRLAARVLDSNAFVISSAMLKTHNSVVATLSVKNMVLGSPLHNAPGEAEWSDKRKFHAGVRQMNYNMLVAAQKLQPFWGLAVIDGFEGMEGDGPSRGTPVESRVAVASTDFVAADRVALELMGIDPGWVGYLNYCGQTGLGQYDLSKIQVAGAAIEPLKKKYALHPDVQHELEWMGPMNQLPPRVGMLLDPKKWTYA
jgi:uncharacterized protein (DUF362 family)